MRGTATYLRYELRYSLSVSGQSATGSLHFESESAPIQNFRDTDAQPQAPYRILVLEDGSTLHFRVTGTGTSVRIIEPGLANVESSVSVQGRIEPPPT